MREERFLCSLLLSDIILTILMVPVAVMKDRFLPPALQAYATADAESPMRLQELVLLVLALPLLLTLIVAWIGLFRYCKSAPLLYLISSVGAVVLPLFEGPTVETAFGTTVDAAAYLISGVILGLVYFSRLRERFEHGTRVPTASGA